MSSYFEPGPLTAAQVTSIMKILLSGTTSAPIVRPNLAGPAVNITSGVGAWVYGAWSQMVAPNDLASHMLIGIITNDQNVTPDSYQLDIGTGGAGSEVVIGTWPIMYITPVGVLVPFPVWPPIQIPANARVAARSASRGGGVALQAKLCFIPRPLA